MASNSVKKQSKSKYCPSIAEGLKISTWLQGDQAKCLTTVKKAIKIFHDHLQSETCDCIAQASNLLILSVDYYNHFLLSLENHNKQVEEEEKKYDSGEEEEGKTDHGHEDEGISGSQLPNIEKTKPSRYSNLLLPQFVNINTQQIILKPLNKCIQYLREALTSASTIPVKLLEGLRVNTLLLSAHNIYQCYSQPDYRYHCARLLIELAGKILPEEKESLLTAYHLLIRLYLDYNVLPKAERFLKMAQTLMTTMKIKGFESYQAALIYLDQCEIEMRSGEFDKSGDKLQKFLQSEYIKKLTLNRYYLKGFACLIASKFPSSYQFSSDYNEFIEPLHITLTILKRWHRQLLYPDEKRPVTVEEDLLWFKYEIYSFSYEVLTMIKTFYLNIGFPMELSFFANCLLALARRNCFLTWSTQTVKLGAGIDMKCDKNKCASLKLQLGILALTFKSSAKPHVIDNEPNSSKIPVEITSTHRTDLDSELPEDGDIDFTSMPGNSGSDQCVHDLGHFPAWEVEKILRKGNYKLDEEDIPVDVGTIMKMLNSSATKLQFPLNLVYVELVSLISCGKKIFDEEVVDKILEISSTFKDSHHPMYSKLIKYLHITSDLFDASGMSDIIVMEANFLDLLTDHYLEKLQFESIIRRLTSFLSKLSFPCISLTIRDLVGRLLLKLIVSKNQLLNMKPHFPEFDSKEVQEKMVRPILACKTPPPVRSNINRMNAPERKPNYRMDELRDYAKSLHDAPKKQAPRKSSRILTRKSSVISEQLSSTDSDIVILSENIEPPIAATPLRRGRPPAKCKTPGVSTRKKADPMTSSKKAIKHPPIDSFLDSLTEAIDCITISDKDIEEEDVFNCQQNLIHDVIKGPSTITANINNLKNLLLFYSNHPPIDVYLVIHYQLFLLYSTINKPNLLAASYHFHECSNSAMIRYRAIFTRENKKRLKLPSELSIENLLFNPVNDVNFLSLSKQVKLIPETWRIVQICSYPNNQSDRGIPDIVISRWQRNKKTLMIRIKGNPDKFTRNFMDEFYEIIELSNASIRKQDSLTFWTARTALNQRLEMLLQSVADAWFGPFKALFMGFTHNPKLNEFRAAIKKSVNNFFDPKFCRDEDLLDCIIEAFPILSKQQFETAMCFLFSQFSFTILEECYHNCLEIFETFYVDGDNQKNLLQNIDFEPVGLIVNKPLEGFPFESLPSAVNANQQFFRIPSLRFLISLVETHMKKDKIYTQGVNHQKGYYLLNPSANLLKTEKRFKDKFLKQTKWKGAIGAGPDSKDLQRSLNSCDLYIYFGHGAGSRYYKSVPDGIDSLSIRTASLIVGCCSGKLFLDGSMFDSFGTPYRFMINGCPTYLGLLWDVTDGDIDRFADRLLNLWLPDWELTESKDGKDLQQSIKFKELCKSLIYARFACRFKLLTGAAPVIYGLPITLNLSP